MDKTAQLETPLGINKKIMNKDYYTIKDEDGVLRPKAFLVSIDEDLKYYQKEIEKFKKENCEFVKIRITEI